MWNRVKKFCRFEIWCLFVWIIFFSTLIFNFGFPVEILVSGKNRFLSFRYFLKIISISFFFLVIFSRDFFFLIFDEYFYMYLWFILFWCLICEIGWWKFVDLIFCKEIQIFLLGTFSLLKIFGEKRFLNFGCNFSI